MTATKDRYHPERQVLADQNVNVCGKGRDMGKNDAILTLPTDEGKFVFFLSRLQARHLKDALRHY